MTTTAGMRILVTGSRDATDVEHREQIEDAINEAVMHTGGRGLDEMVIIVHGDQRGVDLIAADIAAHWPLSHPPMTTEPHNARDFGNWPAAGPRRNAHMVSLGADLCLAFPLPGSKGTWDCAKKAADAGIRVVLRTLHGGAA